MSWRSGDLILKSLEIRDCCIWVPGKVGKNHVISSLRLIQNFSTYYRRGTVPTQSFVAGFVYVIMYLFRAIWWMDRQEVASMSFSKSIPTCDYIFHPLENISLWKNNDLILHNLFQVFKQNKAKQKECLFYLSSWDNHINVCLYFCYAIRFISFLIWCIGKSLQIEWSQLHNFVQWLTIDWVISSHWAKSYIWLCAGISCFQNQLQMLKKSHILVFLC